ncbi:MAG: asparaginase [Actinobacteria bacterium]|nr:asparaginase [Actinomycetota bacterium]
MLAASVRSGLVETVHEGSVAVSDAEGNLIAWSGDIDRPFYLRSAAKPFQAMVSQENGAGLAPIELALASASHRGQPVHVSLTESILAGAGLDEENLRCPPSWPLATMAAQRLLLSGEQRPRRIWNNCSGKHSAFLRACIARGWPTESYLDPGHPLQVEVVEKVSELGAHPASPVGVDGCGAPVLRTTTRAMARLFASLGSRPELGAVFTAMHRYPALVSDEGEGDALLATNLHAVAKGGAQGCLGVAMASGVGVAVKAWDGSHDAAVVAAVAVLDGLGALGDTAFRRLTRVGRPPIHGGGSPVGVLEPRVELVFA